MKRYWVVGVMVGLLVACPMVAHAADATEAQSNGVKVNLTLTKDYTPSPWTKETSYGSRALHKLGFGLENLLLGWTDLFMEPSKAANAGTNVAAGIGRGVKDLIENEVGGVVHVITFPATNVDAPLPDGGVQFK